MSSSEPHGDLSEYVRREDGLYVLHGSGLVGDLEHFHDARGHSKTRFGTALHALHVDHVGAKIIADGEARGMHPHWAAATVPEENVIGRHHLGPGLVTNVGVMALSNDAQVTAGFGTLDVCNWHMSGTGATAETVSDIALQTILTPPVAVAGAQSLVSAPNSQKLQTVATLTYSSTTTVKEWGLFSSATMSATTGSPFTSTSATGGGVASTPFTASSPTVRGQTQMIVVAGTVYGLIVANGTNSLTIPAWYKVADGTAGTTPGNVAYTIQPIMWDHKTFSIPVVNGSSIQYSYLLTTAPGG